MSEGMQIMTGVVAGFVALVAVIAIPVAVTNFAWERVATTCINKGGTWSIISVPGSYTVDWACTLPAPPQEPET